MSERRSLVEGVKNPPPSLDPQLEKSFVFGQKPTVQTKEAIPAPLLARAPLSTRIRADFAAAIKRASLERQLQGVQPSSVQDILEEAIEPWLKANGYLP